MVLLSNLRPPRRQNKDQGKIRGLLGKTSELLGAKQWTGIGVIVAVLLSVFGFLLSSSSGQTHPEPINPTTSSPHPSTSPSSSASSAATATARSSSAATATPTSIGQDGWADFAGPDSYSSSGARIILVNGTEVQVSKLGLVTGGAFGPVVDPTLPFLNGTSLSFNDIRIIILTYDPAKPCNGHLDITATVTLKNGATTQGLLYSTCTYPDYWDVGVLTGPAIGGGTFNLEIQQVKRVNFLP